MNIRPANRVFVNQHQPILEFIWEEGEEKDWIATVELTPECERNLLHQLKKREAMGVVKDA